MIKTEIKVFEGLNTYYNENFKAPAHVRIYSKAPSYIKIEKLDPPYIVLKAKKDYEVKIEIEPIIVPEDAPEEEKIKVSGEVLKLEEKEEKEEKEG